MVQWRKMARRIAPLAAAVLLLIWHTLQYNFVTDDAFISFVYARNLAEHGALVFNPSDLANPVEGYTNFLWTVLLALFMLVGVAPEISSLALGSLFAAATLVVVFRTAELFFDAESRELAPLASALVASSAGFACWASGGLETQMFTFFVVTALCVACLGNEGGRSFRWVGLLLALAAMTRPEGLLIAAIVSVHRLVCNACFERRLLPSRSEWIAAAWFACLWAPWFAWRIWYYGYLFPNTYYVKAAGEVSARYAEVMQANGLHYVWTWARETSALWLAPLALVGALAHRPDSIQFRFGTLALTVLVTYLAYAVRVGGDFMGLHRFVMPATVLLLVLAVIGIVRISGLISDRLRLPRRWLTLSLGLVMFAAFAFSQLQLTRKALDPTNLAADRGIDTPAYLDLYARDRARIGEHMRDCFRPGDFSIFGGVGAKPYRARAEGIDVFGLVSERIAHEVRRTRPRAGHNKWGPDALLAAYDPDFVFSCYSLHRQRDKPQWNCSPGFWMRRGYEQVTLHIPGLVERGEYYTFLVKKARAFSCAGLVQ